ncbi:glutamate--tRNA ligase [Candidatus Pacebacteria bacterium]|nr:glutamate--tRNA ligase [Candidatus Paceibacterota bacterium]
MSEKVTTRFAVSPTGFMHIGGVRTALFSYLWARKNEGTFILRIEDTDKKREVDGAVAHIQQSLEWLGLDWDYGPDKPGQFGSCTQSERLDIYKQYAERLIAKGLAYPDPYTTEETDAFKAEAEANKRPYLFRDHRPTTFAEWDGSKPLRLKVPEVKRYSWSDAARGELSGGQEMLDDVVLIKSDGYPTYNFAHIVDDIEMGVTHVMRGDEFISSMPRFLSIYEALGEQPPVFVSLPPILGPDGKKKLSKRDGAKDLLEYKTEGYLPETMMNFLALIGWNPTGEQEVFTRSELIERFSIEKIQKSGGAFNEEKLKWMNKEHIALLEPAEQIAYVQGALPTLPAEAVAKLAPTILERIHTETEIKAAAAAGEYDWVTITPTPDPAMLAWKKDNNPRDALPRLCNAIELLTTADFSSVESVKDALWVYAEEVGKGELLWPLRVALTGKERSPDPFTVAHVLGKTETILRIQNACDKIGE